MSWWILFVTRKQTFFCLVFITKEEFNFLPLSTSSSCVCPITEIIFLRRVLCNERKYRYLKQKKNQKINFVILFESGMNDNERKAVKYKTYWIIKEFHVYINSSNSWNVVGNSYRLPLEFETVQKIPGLFSFFRRSKFD